MISTTAASNMLKLSHSSVLLYLLSPLVVSYWYIFRLPPGCLPALKQRQVKHAVAPVHLLTTEKSADCLLLQSLKWVSEPPWGRECPVSTWQAEEWTVQYFSFFFLHKKISRNDSTWTHTVQRTCKQTMQWHDFVCVFAFYTLCGYFYWIYLMLYLILFVHSDTLSLMCRTQQNAFYKLRFIIESLNNVSADM